MLLVVAVRRLPCMPAGSEKGDVENAEGEYDTAEVQPQTIEGQEGGTGRDEWLTENSGRNILTGQLPQAKAVDDKPKPDDKPKVSVSAQLYMSVSA